MLNSMTMLRPASLSSSLLTASLLIATAALACSAGDAGSNPDEDGDGDPNGAGGTGAGAGGGTLDPGLNPGTGTGTGGTKEPGEDCDATLELILRDFNSDHPDFEAFNGGQNEVGCQIVMPTLDTADGRRSPIFQAGSGTGQRQINQDTGIITCTPWDQYYTGPAVVTSADTFNQWYANVDGVNMMVRQTLPLTATAEGTYVFDSADTPPGFFPLDGQGFNEVTQGHNYHFTTEAHVRFGYQAGQKFTFSGDDDLWIFVNGKLALDLGGMHMPLTATLDFDAMADELGISPGRTYNMDIFHAERHTSASNFRVETNISCFETVEVPVIR